MNRLMQWVIAAALICSSTVFTSCMNDDNPVGPSDNLAEKLIGKWMDYEADGQPALTTGKMVVTFVSPTKALYSTTKSDFSESQRKWSDHREYDVTISDNKVTLTGHPDGNPKITLQEEFIISSITANEIVCNYKHITIHDGQGQGSVTGKKEMRLKKIDIDYHTDIVGMWECKGISGGETYNDANARLEFFNDATYKYYRKNNGGLWEVVTNREFQEYIADGTLVAIRWEDQGMAELRECWEVNSLKDGKMQWKALRAKEDGTTFEQTVDWERVEE